MSGEQQKIPICTQLWAYILIIYKVLQVYCMPYDNGMDKFEVNDDINIHNMNTLNNETKHGGNDT